MDARAWVAVGLGLLVGCGGSGGGTGADDPATVSSAASSEPARAEGSTRTGSSGGADDRDGGVGAPDGGALGLPGSSFDAPLETCGTDESYAAIASYECPDGSIPLGGDPRAGHRARLGSSRSHVDDPPSLMESHIVDIYEVPCPKGPVRVYVCMYHCPKGQTPSPKGQSPMD